MYGELKYSQSCKIYCWYQQQGRKLHFQQHIGALISNKSDRMGKLLWTEFYINVNSYVFRTGYVLYTLDDMDISIGFKS